MLFRSRRHLDLHGLRSHEILNHASDVDLVMHLGQPLLIVQLELQPMANGVAEDLWVDLRCTRAPILKNNVLMLATAFGLREQRTDVLAVCQDRCFLQVWPRVTTRIGSAHAKHAEVERDLVDALEGSQPCEHFGCP